MDETAGLLTESDAAGYLGVTPVFLAKQRARSVGPPYLRLGTRKGIRYRKSDLDAFVASRVVRSGDGDGADKSDQA